MLDNMDADTMREAVKLIRETPVPDGRPRPQTEASGGIDLENLPEIAALGVDRISIGALTHSAPALDISMEVVQ